MTRTEAVQLIAIGYLLAQPKKVSEVRSTAFDGWKRAIVDEIRRSMTDKTYSPLRLRELCERHMGISGDGKLAEKLMEALAELADVNEALANPRTRWQAQQYRLHEAIRRKREQGQKQ